MIGLGLAAALLLIVCLGFGFTVFFSARKPTIHWAELLSLSWLLGTFSLSLALAGLGTVTRGLPLMAILTLAALGSFAWGRQLLKRRHCRIEGPRRPHGWSEYLYAAIHLAGLLLLSYRAYSLILGWDGMLVWEIKARYAFLNGGAIPLAYFADDSRQWSHPEYPLYLPLVETWLYLWMGEAHQVWLKGLFVSFYLSALLLLYSGLRRCEIERPIRLAAIALFWLLPYPLFGRWGVSSGYADFPLATFYLAALIYLPCRRWGSASAQVWLFGFLAACLPWIKREGALLWLCLMVPATLCLWREKRFAASFIAPTLGLCTILGWKLATKILHTPPNTDFLPLTPAMLAAHADRLSTLFEKLAGELLMTSHWSILWPAFALAVLFLLRRREWKVAAQSAWCVAAPLLLYTFVYTFSSWPHYLDHVDVSLVRLILHVAPAAYFLTVLATHRTTPAFSSRSH